MTRRRWLLAAVLAIALIAAAGAGWLVASDGDATTPTAALGPPRFVDETDASSLDHVFAAGGRVAVGGGIAVFDCDDDGLPDLYIAGGVNQATLYRNRSRPGGPLAFIAAQDTVLDMTDVMGAYPLDIDGDAITDLAVLRVGGADLLLGRGDCRFEIANDGLSFSAAPDWTTAFSAMWEGAASLPTVALGGYVGLDQDENATYSCPDNQLFRPNAAGSGYGPAIPLAPGFCALSMLFSDWDGSGRRDLRVSNDRHYYDDDIGQEQLWRVAPGEPPRLYTADDGWLPVRIWGMGIGSYDVTGDGYPDVYLTSQGPNKLETLSAGPDQPTYQDIAIKTGVIATRPAAGGDPLPSTAWHPEFQDVNDDGFIDLFVSKGNVDQVPDYAARDPSDLFIGGPDGTFTYGAEEAGILDFDKGRGAALVDFNADGMLDLVQVNLDAPVRVWRNVGSGTATDPIPMGHWLGVVPRQPGPNPDAIGAVVEVRLGDLISRRELTVGGGHVGGQLGPIHFGLGRSDTADVRVTWPDGEIGPWLPTTADQIVRIDRGSPEARPWTP